MRNVLIYIYLHCVSRSSWSATTLATLARARNIKKIKTDEFSIKVPFSWTHRTQNISKNQNLYPQKSQITLFTLPWDTLYFYLYDQLEKKMGCQSNFSNLKLLIPFALHTDYSSDFNYCFGSTNPTLTGARLRAVALEIWKWDVYYVACLLHYSSLHVHSFVKLLIKCSCIKSNVLSVEGLDWCK